MDKKLKKIIDRLGKERLNSLTAEEISLYFEHRTERLLNNKKVLVKDELEYLLSETGPGHLRFDPRYLNLLLKHTVFLYHPFKSIPEIIEIGNAKQKVESYIISNRNSNKTRDGLKSILEKYIRKFEIISEHPLVIYGTIKKIPVGCIVKNGEWILPNPELFSFLKQCQNQTRFPIIIAKKNSGILFPVFKTLSVLGLNTYKTYLPEEAKKIIESISSTEETLKELKYNNQFVYLAKKTGKTKNGDEVAEPISIFFEDIVENNIINYHANFMAAKIKITDNFMDTANQFKKNRATKGLLENYQRTQKIIRDLRG